MELAADGDMKLAVSVTQRVGAEGIGVSAACKRAAETSKARTSVASPIVRIFKSRT